jgi:hypothetical protein
MTLLYHLLAAYAVLLGSGEPPAQPPCPLWCAKAAAVDMEVMDADSPMLDPDYQPWSDAIATLRARVIDLADAPRLADAALLPPVTVCAWGRNSLDERIAWWESRIAGGIDLWDVRHQQVVLDSLRERRAVWNAACYGSDPDSAVWLRRDHLRELRRLLGDEAYYGDRLPPALEAWMFGPVD